MAEFVAVAAEGDLGEGEMMGVQVAGKRVLLARVEGEVYAISALCSHEEGYLDEGDLDGCDAICPIHFAAFDVRTGAVKAPPADRPVPAYDVRIEAGQILVSTAPKGS